MAQTTLTDKDKRILMRYAHVYQDHPEIYKDLYKQYLAGNPDPKINQDLVVKNLNLKDGTFSTFVEETGDPEVDAKNQAAFERHKRINGGLNAVSYDVFERDKSPKEAMQDYPDNFFGNLAYGLGTVAYGTGDAFMKAGKGLSETLVGVPADLGSYALSKATGVDLQTQVLKKIDEDFPSINTTGGSAFIGTAGQFIGGYKIGEALLARPVVKKVKNIIKKKTATTTGMIAAKAPITSSIAQQTVKYATPALIGEPLVATSTDRTVLQALSPLTEQYMGFKLAEDMVDPRDPNLSPKDRALAVLGQKARFGLEAPLVVGGLSVGINGVGKFASPYLLSAASKGKGALGWTFDVGRAVLASEKTGLPQTVRLAKAFRQKIGEMPGVRRIPSVKDWKLYNPNGIRFINKKGQRLDTGIQKTIGVIDSVLRAVRTNEALTPEAKAIQRRAIAQIEKVKSAIIGNFKIMSNSLHKTVDEMTQSGRDGSRWQKKIMTEDLIKYVLNPSQKSFPLFKGASKDFKIAAAKIKREMATIKRMYGRLNLPEDDLITNVAKNMHEYVTTSFKIVDDSSYTLKPDSYAEVVEAFKSILRFDKRLLDQKEALRKQLDSGEIQGNLDELYEEVLERDAIKRITDLQDLASGENMSSAKLIKLANDKLDEIGGIQSMNRLRKGQELPPIVSKLFGKVDDPQVALTNTIMELTDAVIKTNMYEDLARVGQGKFIFDNPDDLFKATGALTRLQQISLKGVGNSKIPNSLEGKWTVPAMKESIETMGGVLWKDRFLSFPLIKSYLAAKSFSQIEKTVLSPTTQIRNVTSAGTFALAAGHVGNGASFKQAFDFIFKEVFAPNGAYDDAIMKSKIDEYIEKGVINTNMVVKELDYLIKDSLKANPLIVDTDGLLSRLYNSPFMEKAIDIYRAGDDIWKIYGYEFEKSLTRPHMRNLDDIVKYYREVFGREFDVEGFIVRTTGGKPSLSDLRSLPKLTESQLDEAVREISADIIKNVYPNYDAVSPLVKNMRRVPLGNFISFPAEMIRTQANLIKYGLNELGSSNPGIRKKGAGRLMGLFSALTLPYVAGKTAQNLYGISDNMMDKFQDAFTPEWNKDAPLAITDVSINKDGDTIVKYVATGYQFPHAQITLGPFYKALDAIQEGKATGDTGSQIFFDSVLTAFGTVIQPFASGEIVASAISDVVSRRGETIDGKTIYYQHDDTSEKLTKSMLHIAKQAFVPGVFTQADKFIKAADNLFEKDRKNLIYTNQGLPYDIGTEFMATFMGVREYTVNVHKSFRKYEVGAFAKTLENTRAKMAKESFDPNMTNEQILKAYEDQQLEEYKVFNQFSQTVEAARLWGVDDKEIYEYMAGRSGLVAADPTLLLDGKFNAASLPNFSEKGRIFEILKNRGLSNIEIGNEMRKLYNQMQRIQMDYLNMPLGWTNAKVKAYIRFKREKQYQKNMQQSSVVPQTNTATAPLTMPNQVVQPVAQMASNQTAVPPVATQTADPVTTRQRIIENDEFLKDLA